MPRKNGNTHRPTKAARRRNARIAAAASDRRATKRQPARPAPTQHTDPRPEPPSERTAVPCRQCATPTTRGNMCRDCHLASQ
jgi:hypothetical protein